MTVTDQALADLLDREAIRELRVGYAHCLDGGDLEGLIKVFTEDAVVAVTTGPMIGFPAIRKGLEKAYRLFDRDKRGRYPFLHVIANHRIRLTGPDTAEGECYLVDFETASKPDPDPLLLLGLYRDAYSRIEGEWRIARSTLEVVWPDRAPA